MTRQPSQKTLPSKWVKIKYNNFPVPSNAYCMYILSGRSFNTVVSLFIRKSLLPRNLVFDDKHFILLI